MSSKAYWEKREAEALKHYLQEEQEYQAQLRAIYQNMLDAAQKEIDAFYGRYADKEQITLAEAKRRVSKLDIAAYQRKAKRYVADKDFSKQANEEMRLYTLTMKVNRLEMLKANIGLELVAGHNVARRSSWLKSCEDARRRNYSGRRVSWARPSGTTPNWRRLSPMRPSMVPLFPSASGATRQR